MPGWWAPSCPCASHCKELPDTQSSAQHRGGGDGVGASDWALDRTSALSRAWRKPNILCTHGTLTAGYSFSQSWLKAGSLPPAGHRLESTQTATPIHVPPLGTGWGRCLNCGPDHHQPCQNPSGNKVQNGGMTRKFKVCPGAEGQTPEQSLWTSESHPHYSTWQGSAWPSSHHRPPPFHTRQHRNHFCWTEALIILLEPLHSVQVMQKNVPEQP